MSKKKRYRGNYCKVCNSILSNEKFSGGGHSRHICKKCSKLSVEQRQEKGDLNRIYELFRFTYLSKANRLMLEKYLDNISEKVRLAAKEMIEEFEEKARLIRMDEDLVEIYYGNGEFLDDGDDNYEDDNYLDDLYRMEGELEFDIDSDDELPF